jgi:YHS domain-containing protein
MTVDTATAVASTRHNGEMYYFCSMQCEREFSAHPERYTNSRATVNAAGRERDERDARDESDAPHTTRGGITAPKFGSAGSGGAEYERGPERQ